MGLKKVIVYEYYSYWTSQASVCKLIQAQKLRLYHRQQQQVIVFVCVSVSPCSKTRFVSFSPWKFNLKSKRSRIRFLMQNKATTIIQTSSQQLHITFQNSPVHLWPPVKKRGSTWIKHDLTGTLRNTINQPNNR